MLTREQMKTKIMEDPSWVPDDSQMALYEEVLEELEEEGFFDDDEEDEWEDDDE